MYAVSVRDEEEFGVTKERFNIEKRGEGKMKVQG